MTSGAFGEIGKKELTMKINLTEKSGGLVHIPETEAGEENIPSWRGARGTGLIELNCKAAELRHLCFASVPSKKLEHSSTSRIQRLRR
jgi:hypothetical protein